MQLGNGLRPESVLRHGIWSLESTAMAHSSRAHINDMEHFTRITACKYLFWPCRGLCALRLDGVYNLWLHPQNTNKHTQTAGIAYLWLGWRAPPAPCPHTFVLMANSKSQSQTRMPTFCACMHARTAHLYNETSACTPLSTLSSQKWRRVCRVCCVWTWTAGDHLFRRPNSDGIHLKWCFHCDA